MKFIPLSVSLLAGATLASAQTNPGAPSTTLPPRDRAPADPVQQLDTLIVTGALENKTAFDLAQGSSILSGHTLEHRSKENLGALLDGLPGVSSTAYAPGSGRPIIRGFGGDRVRMLSEGVGALDLSTLSPDHAVAVEPLLAERVEVLRGPATLLYGNSAVGGVVNVIEGRVPLESTPLFSSAEARWDSNSNGRAGVFAAGGSQGTSGFKVQGTRSRSDDMRVPLAGGRRVEGTSTDSQSVSVGLGLHATEGNWGFAVSQLESDYGVPVDDEAIGIDLRQRRLDLAGNQNLDTAIFRSLRVRWVGNDYRHFERDREGEREIHTEFTQKGWDGRVELQQVKFGAFSGVTGVQLGQTSVKALGEEVVTPPYRQDQAALFTLQEWSTPGLSLQLGGRLERQRLRLGEVPDDLPAVPGYAAMSNETRKGVAPSVGAGVVWYPDQATSVALSVNATERMPLGQELFSNGPHGGTGTYEVGRGDLGRERSTGVELSFRRRVGEVTGSVSVFAQRFGNYLYEEKIDDTLVPADRNDEGLPVYQFNGTRAFFYGGEAELAFHLLEGDRENLHLELVADYVHAEDRASGHPLPRITPARIGAGLTYERGDWFVGATVRQVFRQSRVADDETPTAGYLLLGAEAGWGRAYGRHRVEVFARGQNLGDRLARVHTSFLKDAAPVAGRGVTVGLRYMY